MKKSFSGFLLLFWLAFSASGQQILLEQDVKKDAEPKKWGANLKHFIHPFVGYGFVAGASENEGSQVEYGKSHDWQIGLRYKLKIAKYYAVGLDATLNPQTFYIKQHKGKTLPAIGLEGSEKMRITNISLGFYNRFNFGKRGNYVGRFIDLGIYGNWLASSTHIVKGEYPDSNMPGAEEIEVKLKGLNYLTDFNYGVTARMGFNRYVFYGTYRLSDLFNLQQGKDLAEFPKMVIGFELGLHR